MIEKIHIRELTEEDFSLFCQFVANFADILEEQICFAPTAVDLRRHTFEDPDFNGKLLLGLFDHAGTLQAVAFGVIRSWKDPEKGFIKFIFCKSSSNREKFLSLILKELEKRLIAEKVSCIHFGSSSPLYLFPGVDEEDKTLCSVLAEHGWDFSSERINRIIDMKNLRISQVDLTKLLQKTDCANFADPHWENIEKLCKYSITIALPDDKKELYSFISNEFSKSWAEESIAGCRADNPAFCSIIKDNSGKIAGFAAVNASNPNWFGPMGIKQSLRGKGLGKLLVIHSLLHTKETFPKKEHILLPWINDKDNFYCSILGDMKKNLYHKAIKNIDISKTSIIIKD